MSYRHLKLQILRIIGHKETTYIFIHFVMREKKLDVMKAWSIANALVRTTDSEEDDGNADSNQGQNSEQGIESVIIPATATTAGNIVNFSASNVIFKDSNAKIIGASAVIKKEAAKYTARSVKKSAFQNDTDNSEAAPTEDFEDNIPDNTQIQASTKAAATKANGTSTITGSGSSNTANTTGGDVSQREQERQKQKEMAAKIAFVSCVGVGALTAEEVLRRKLLLKRLLKNSDPQGRLR